MFKNNYYILFERFSGNNKLGSSFRIIRCYDYNLVKNINENMIEIQKQFKCNCFVSNIFKI